MVIKSKVETILIIFAALILIIFFSYKLNYSALLSYDEAWYGEITRNLVASKNPLTLRFNDSDFTDHPPLGYVLMAIPTSILGSNEFSVRFTSVSLGVGTLIVLYLLGKKFAGSMTGIAAAAILMSSMWFMLRTRSGNLDVPFMFWEVLTVYLLLIQHKKALYFAAISFAALILTKTLVGFGLLPVILFIIWFRRKELQKNSLIKAFCLLLILVLPWYIFNQLRDPNFFQHHFFEIGARGSSNSYGLETLKPVLLYLAIGIGKWYKVFLISLLLGVIVFVRQKQQRFYLGILLFWFLGFSVFLFSSKTEIWHLLPLYPVISLFISFATLKIIEWLFKQHKTSIRIFVGIGFIGLAAYQFHQFANLIYLKEPAFSSEKDIALKAGKYQKVYLVETFYPAAVYYAQQHIEPLNWSATAFEQMTALLQSNAVGVFIINADTKASLEKQKIDFQVLDGNQSYYLISNER